MKILLLGGTGAMGKHLADILLAQDGNDVTVTTRKFINSDKDQLRYLNGNAHDPRFLETVLKEKWDVIVDFMVYGTEEFQDRVFRLLEACSQYVFLSSSRVYADSGTPIVESSPRLLDVSKDAEYLQTDEYALTKARQENILRNSGRTNWTIIRPYITYAENRLQLGVLELRDWLCRALLGHTIVFSEDIAEHVTTMTYGFDVARGIAAVLGKEKAFGKAFHITGNESKKWKDILQIYLDIIERKTGRRPTVKMLPRHPYPDSYQVRYDRMLDRKFDNANIGQFLDISSFLSINEGIRKSLSAFLDSNTLLKFPLNPAHEAKYDRITGERMPLKNFRSRKDRLIYLQQRYFPWGTPLIKLLRKSLKGITR